MRFVYPGFKSLSEFIAKKNGDCGALAMLLCLNILDPKRWPLTAAALGELVADLIKRGMAAENGAMNIPEMDAYLKALGVSHSTVGYAAYTEAALHGRLKLLADPARRQLVIVEWSAAGKGLHDDEPGVQYHYSAFGGIDTGVKNDGVGGGYLRGDGDSRTDSSAGAPTDPILTRWSDIQAAKPIAFITIPVPVPAPPVKPPVKPPTPSAVDQALSNVKVAVATLEAAVAAAKV